MDKTDEHIRVICKKLGWDYDEEDGTVRATSRYILYDGSEGNDTQYMILAGWVEAACYACSPRIIIRAGYNSVQHPRGPAMLCWSVGGSPEDESRIPYEPTDAVQAAMAVLTAAGTHIAKLTQNEHA